MSDILFTQFFIFDNFDFPSDELFSFYPGMLFTNKKNERASKELKYFSSNEILKFTVHSAKTWKT